MIVTTFLGLVAFVVLVGLLDWRKGVLLCLPIGFLQDATRKMSSDQSVAWLTTVVVCFGVCYVGMLLRERHLGIVGLLSYYQRLQAPALLFAAIVLVQTVAGFLRTGSPLVAGIGLLFYFSPPLLLLLGVRYSVDLTAWRRWLLVYVGCVTVVAGSVLLQFVGFDSPLFRSIGVEIVFGSGGQIRMMAGLMRSSEIAAWHLAAAFCLSIVGAVAAQRFFHRIVAAGLAGSFFVTVLLTGRRKMLGEIVLFGVLFAVFLAGHRRGFTRILRIAVILLLAGVVTGQLLSSSTGSGIGPYVERGISVIGESGQRLERLTIGAFGVVVRQNGFFGSGAGTGSQGSQYFGGGNQVVGRSAEGGLAKILAELGVPGLMAMLWLLGALTVTMLAIGRGMRRLPASFAIPTYGIMAFLPANLAVFATAHQVFGDPFVLILLGWLTGMLLAVPRMAHAAGLTARSRTQPDRPRARHTDSGRRPAVA